MKILIHEPNSWVLRISQNQKNDFPKVGEVDPLPSKKDLSKINVTSGKLKQLL